VVVLAITFLYFRLPFLVFLLYHLQYSSTDIMSGEIANIIFANLKFDEGDNYLELYFEFNTLLLERYYFSVDILIRIDNDSYDSYVYSFEDPRKIEVHKEDT